MTQKPEISRREIEVLTLIVDGCTNADIADRLCVSPRTAQAHVARLMAKTATKSRTELAVFALRAGLVPLHPEPSDG